jgi:hypothetical protein
MGAGFKGRLVVGTPMLGLDRSGHCARLSVKEDKARRKSTLAFDDEGAIDAQTPISEVDLSAGQNCGIV